jgi:predicted O-methyltransferase YrrM
MSVSSDDGKTLPVANFDRLVSEIHDRLKGVTITIKGREVRFLALLGAYPTAPGTVLEIGAFKGASTIALSMAARAAGDDHIWTVDPFSNPCEGALSDGTCYPEFLENLRRAGQEHSVKVFKGLSQDLAREWTAPIRLLWIDGDHSYKGAKQDFDMFRPFLSEGAIVAFHDVLASPPGPCRVFANEVLLSRDFGACGISGTIGWGQYRKAATDQQKERKLRLYSSIASHVCASTLRTRLPRLDRLRYLLLRNSHRGCPQPRQFVEETANGHDAL